MTTKTSPRSLSIIASEIRKNWTKANSGSALYFGAVPYLDAMSTLDKITDNYMFDSGRSIVAYFLANAQTWKGETARNIKKELNAMLKSR
jgi:hypothetical protein